MLKASGDGEVETYAAIVDINWNCFRASKKAGKQVSGRLLELLP